MLKALIHVFAGENCCEYEYYGLRHQNSCLPSEVCLGILCLCASRDSFPSSWRFCLLLIEMGICLRARRCLPCWEAFKRGYRPVCSCSCSCTGSCTSKHVVLGRFDFWGFHDPRTSLACGTWPVASQLYLSYFNVYCTSFHTEPAVYADGQGIMEDGKRVG